MLSILNNIPALQAENALDVTTNEANNSLEQLSTGSRINSGSDDAAGLAISDGLNANVAALNQSSLNVTDGVGELQTADGAMSQITSLLNRAVTIATEASNGTVSTAQLGTINTEFQAILGEINNIGTTTNYNGQAIFSQSTGVTDATIGSTNTTYGTATAASNDLDLFTSDGTAGGTKTFSVTVNAVDAVALGLTTGTGTGVTNLDLLSQTFATKALTALTSAVATISQDRGTLGATVEQLQAASQVDTTESANLTSASSDITSADIGQVVANDTSYSILEQTGISALQQASQQQENVLKLLQ